MKTKYLLYLLLAGTLFPTLSAAQSPSYRSYFGDEFTHWYTYYSFYDLELSELSKVEGDTILPNGTKYKQLIKDVSFFGSSCFGIREEIETGSLFINTDGTTEIMVSTMNLEKGDKFYFHPNIDLTDLGVSTLEGIKNDEAGKYTLVDSVYYKDNRKHIRFEAHYFPFYFDIPLTFIEGIGPNISFDLFSGNSWFSVCFLCYETERGLWKNMNIKIRGREEYLFIHDGECLFRYSSIPVVKENFPFKVIRQKEKIKIQPDGVDIKHGTASIYSTDGRLLASKAIQNNLSVSFSLYEFSKGIYIIYVKDVETGKAWSKKTK
jgi:hypothetical protein